MTRHAGFVIGSDQTNRGTVWKVRVKDDTSPHNNEKLIVASVHGDVQLAQGLNVTFIIGTIDNQNKQKEVRAVDVRLEAPAHSQTQQTKVRKDTNE